MRMMISAMPGFRTRREALALARTRFVASTAQPRPPPTRNLRDASLADFLPQSTGADLTADAVPPYLARSLSPQQSFFVESYGCQMNLSDTEIVASILVGAGYERTTSESDADIVLLNTCAVRDNAEKKIWQRLATLRAQKQRADKRLVVGVLGCMVSAYRSAEAALCVHVRVARAHTHTG